MTSQEEPEPPYGPGAICDECGHFAMHHDAEGCFFLTTEKTPCVHGKDGQPCTGMLWRGYRWPDPRGGEHIKEGI